MQQNNPQQVPENGQQPTVDVGQVQSGVYQQVQSSPNIITQEYQPLVTPEPVSVGKKILNNIPIIAAAVMLITFFAPALRPLAMIALIVLVVSLVVEVFVALTTQDTRVKKQAKTAVTNTFKLFGILVAAAGFLFMCFIAFIMVLIVTMPKDQHS
ncbi:MAG: hypothetical protein U0491_00505 [Candidatus Saccharimonadales bacterium]